MEKENPNILGESRKKVFTILLENWKPDFSLDKITDEIMSLLSQQKQEMVEKIEEEIKAAHIDWQQDDIFLDGFKEGLKTAKVIITKQ